MSRMSIDELTSCCEIVELTDKCDSNCKISSIEDDINKLFEAIGIGSSCQGITGRPERNLGDGLHTSLMKKPMRAAPQVSGIGISEAVSLKQALRKLCISQASEIAATKKQMSRLSASPVTSEARAIRKLRSSIVIEAGEGNGKPNMVEISLIPERSSTNELLFVKLGQCKNADSSKDCNSDSDLGKQRYRNFVRRKNLLKKPCAAKTRSPRKGGDDNCCVSNAISSTQDSEMSKHDIVSGSSHCRYQPHMSNEFRREAISSARKKYGSLGWKHFKLLRKISSGDIAMVYLCELIDTNCLFMMKVRDIDSTTMAETEKEILEILDHPFLPTLYAHFLINNFSCLVMEYCPGSDLHAIQQKQKQPTKCFPEKGARFYAAEVLLALEYLHLLGVVHRDVRPENVLVREDGHIMLSNFDSSLRCAVKPRLLNLSSLLVDEPPKRMPSLSSDSSCMDPFCLRPSWPLSCLNTGSKTHSETSAPAILVPQLIIKGEDHVSSCDWWSFGVFLYELLFGRTPFIGGSNNEETASNELSNCLSFPQTQVSRHAEDLIRKLLIKDPENRLGSAAEIKLHPFFEGLNWALIRQETPPEFVESGKDYTHTVSESSKSFMIPLEPENREDEIEFEMFYRP